MPIRLLRPTLRTSERWHRSSYFDRCLYISLLNLVDDFGRYEANTTLLASECFPYGDELGLPMTPAAIDGGLRSLASKGLLDVYTSEGKDFLVLLRWKERVRQQVSRYPDPKCCKMKWSFSEICGQQPSNDSKCQQPPASPPSPFPFPTPTPTPSPARATPAESVCDSSNVYELKSKFKADTRFEWLQGELCKAYHRPRPVVAIGEEQRLVAEISRREDVQKEWREIEAYRPKVESRYFPQTILSLCQAWDKTLDRARNYREPVKPEAKKSLAERQLEKLNKQILAEK
jgi:hypothetical protein